MKDNFSKQANNYAKYRPAYPEELFDFILRHTDQRQNAWDCATGNGQSAKALANYFDKVFATDISQKQIDNAEPAPNIYYSVQAAEETRFDEDTFDLITVSQALHWFATAAFFKEVKRVAKPFSVLAAWSYSLLFVSPEIDKAIRSFYTKIIGPYWDPERRYVDDEYKTILFPVKEIPVPPFEMEYYWSLAALEGYISTWSAVQKFIASKGFDPVPELIQQIIPYWTNERMKIRFPLHVRMGRIEK